MWFLMLITHTLTKVMLWQLLDARHKWQAPLCLPACLRACWLDRCGFSSQGRRHFHPLIILNIVTSAKLLLSFATYLCEVWGAVTQAAIVPPATCHMVHAAPEGQHLMKCCFVQPLLRVVHGDFADTCNVTQGLGILPLSAILDDALLAVPDALLFGKRPYSSKYRQGDV